MRKSLDYHRIQKNPLAENFDQHTTAKAVKNGTDLSSKDFPQHISNPSKINSKPFLPSQSLNPKKILKKVDLADNYTWSGKQDSSDIIENLVVDDFVETSAKKLKSSARYKVAGDTPQKSSK